MGKTTRALYEGDVSLSCRRRKEDVVVRHSKRLRMAELEKRRCQDRHGHPPPSSPRSGGKKEIRWISFGAFVSYLFIFFPVLVRSSSDEGDSLVPDLSIISSSGRSRTSTTDPPAIRPPPPPTFALGEIFRPDVSDLERRGEGMFARHRRYLQGHRARPYGPGQASRLPASPLASSSPSRSFSMYGRDAAFLPPPPPPPPAESARAGSQQMAPRVAQNDEDQVVPDISSSSSAPAPPPIPDSPESPPPTPPPEQRAPPPPTTHRVRTPGYTSAKPSSSPRGAGASPATSAARPGRPRNLPPFLFLGSVLRPPPATYPSPTNPRSRRRTSRPAIQCRCFIYPAKKSSRSIPKCFNASGSFIKPTSSQPR